MYDNLFDSLAKAKPTYTMNNGGVSCTYVYDRVSFKDLELGVLDLSQDHHRLTAKIGELRAQISSQETVINNVSKQLQEEIHKNSEIDQFLMRIFSMLGLKHEVTQEKILDAVDNLITRSNIEGNFQTLSTEWVIETLGVGAATDVQERRNRFLEESLELAQAAGMNANEAYSLVDYVFARQIGDPAQEIGGVMATLACLGTALKLNVRQCAEEGLVRMNSPEIRERVRRKHATRPAGTPLPGSGFMGEPKDDGPSSREGIIIDTSRVADSQVTIPTLRPGQVVNVSRLKQSETGEFRVNGTIEGELVQLAPSLVSELREEVPSEELPSAVGEVVYDAPPM